MVWLVGLCCRVAAFRQEDQPRKHALQSGTPKERNTTFCKRRTKSFCFFFPKKKAFLAFLERASLELPLQADFPDWARHFAEGAADPGSAWRNLALGSIGLDGAPQIRTVVLRRFAGLTLDVHTDARSAKFTELRANPAATLHGWDPASAIQLRACGSARLHVEDAVAEEAWAGLREQTRATYRVQPGPGTRLAGPDSRAPDATDTEARRVFCVICLEIEAVDWLHLSKEGNRRARFSWRDGAAQAAWVVA